MMEWVKVVPYVAFLVGVVAGVGAPYLRKWLEEGVAFDWRKVAGKAAVALLGLALMPQFAEILRSLGGLGWALAFAAGIAATTVGHEAQALPGAWRAGRVRGVLRGRP